MAGKTMTACMGRNATGNTGKFGTFLKELVNTGYIQISTGPGTWEKDIFRTPTLKPILCEKVKILLRQNRISVNSAFGFPNMNRHVGTGNVIIMEMNNL